MKPLATPKQVLPFICLCPLDASISKSKKTIYISLCTILMAMTVATWISGFVYIWKFISVDLEGSLFEFSMSFGVIGITYILIVLLMSREKIAEIFEQLDIIYEGGEIKKNNLLKSAKTLFVIFQKERKSPSDFWHVQMTKVKNYGQFF